MRDMERLSAHTHSLPQLVVGDCVRIQNQTGPHPTKWDKTGIIIEVRQFDQYIVVRVDGSGRVTLRNRKFLRRYTPVIPRSSITSLPTPNAITQTESPLGTPHSPPKPLATPTLQNTQELDDNTPPIQLDTEPTVAGGSKDDTSPPQTSQPLNEIDNRPPNTSITPKHMPRALRALQPFNKPGLKEQLPTTTRTRLRHK